MREKQLTLRGGSVVSAVQRKKECDEFVERMCAIFRPKLVMPGYQDIPIPEEMQTAILIERLVLAKTGDRLASEAETLWYLSTASLCGPFDHHWTNVFLYLARQYFKGRRKELPDFLKRSIVLEKYTEEEELFKLRRWLYREVTCSPEMSSI